jgi:hypothetical protein
MLGRRFISLWSHTREARVVGNGNRLVYEIPLYFEREMDAKLVSVSKSTSGKQLILEYCLDIEDRNAQNSKAEMPGVPKGEVQVLR